MLPHSFASWSRYLLFILIPVLAGCLDTISSGDGEDAVADSPLTGVLLDGPTSGVSYTDGNQTGTTNANGEFSYFPGDTIVFSIGGIKLGEVLLEKPDSNEASVVVTPVEITGSADASDPKVVRLLQFLQSLDSDGDHSNGITISEATVAAAASVVVDFADDDFEVSFPAFDLQSTVDDISDPNDPVPTIVSAGEALQNFSDTLEENNLNIPLTPTFQLVWADEFNATTLNTEDWNYETGYGPNNAGWGNDEWQEYTQNSDNLSIVFEDGSDAENGYLKISAQCPAPGTANADCQKRNGSITSAKINTKDKQEFQFGKIEARIKVPTGKGAWPAFWSLGAGYPDTPWPAAGEIDFMEVFSVNNSTDKDALFTIHWEETDGQGDRQFVTTEQAIDATEFHVFEAEWNSERITGKIDGVQFANYTFNTATQSEFLNPFYLILNVAMGGNPLPDLVPDATTDWPQEMLVDYIRVYQAVGDFNAAVVNIDFESSSQFVCLEDGAGCGGATGFAGGDASVQANPDTTGNTSANVARFLKFDPGNGQAFGGTLVRLVDDALDFAASNNIFTVKVYSTRSVPVRLELGDANPNDGSPGIEVVHSGSGWEELTFDVSSIVSQVTKFNQIVFIFDNGVVGDADGNPANWTFYFDDIVLQKSPEDTIPDTGTGGSGGTGGGTASGGSVPNDTILASDGATAVLTSTFTGFDSGTGTAIVSTDSSYSNVLEVTVANGYTPTLNLAQLFITGLSSLDAYNEFLFKVKGLTDNNLVLKIEPPGGPDVAINLASPGAGITVTDLGDGWSQVVVDLTQFGDLSTANVVIMQTLDNAYALGDTFLLTDIGFNAAGPVTATGGSVPDASVFEKDGSTADLSTSFDPFGSGSSFATITTDSSYGSVLETTVGAGYGGGALLQLGITGLSSVDSYGALLFKLKGLTGNSMIVKLEATGGGTVTVDLASPGTGVSVTDLGDGWSQVVIDMAQFGDVSAVSQAIFQTADGAYAAGAKILFTDIGFNNAGGGSAVNLVAATGQAVLLKQIEIGKGVVTNGDEVTVSFDLKTVFTQPGPNVNGQIFVEVDGGGVTQTVQIPAIVADQNETETVVFTVDPSIDVSGGITLQLNAVCGGDAGCESNAVVDNVSVVIGGGNNLVVNGDFETGSLDDGWSTSAAGAGTLTIVAEDSATSIGGGTGGGDPVPVGDGIELLTNGDFETSGTDKAPWANAGTVATNTFYTVNANDGGNVFDTNLSQTVALTNGVDYVLSYRARASVERSIVVGIGDGGAPFVATLETPAPTLTTEWQTFTHALTASNDGGAASRVLFDLGTVASTVDIDDVSLELASAPGVNLLTNGDFETSATDKAPWTNAGTVTTNNFYTVDANAGGNVFDTNLSQTIALTNGVEYVLSYRVRASVERDAVVGIGDAGAPFVATLVTPAPTFTTEWQTFTHALTATNDGGAASRVLFDLGTVASTVDIDDVSLQVIDTSGGGGSGTGGEIAVNGGLESGLTGWEATPNGGTSELSTAEAHTGVNSARVRADVAANGGGASFPDIKIANVGVGTVTNGQAVTVSFWTKTVEQTGAVPFFAQLFTEQAGGGASKTDFLIQPPTFLTTGDWTQHSFNVTLGADASAGVSLLFKADCGATPNCVLDVFIDDVSIQ